MNLNEFQNGEIDNSNIVDPNLARRQGTQNNSNNSNQPRPKKVVSPKDMGFVNEEPEKLGRPEDPILDSMEKAIARKQREARLLAAAIEESDGEGVSEEEFQDLLVQARDEINEDDGIPSESDLRDQVMPPKSTITMIPDENPTYDLMNELDRELKEDEEDYKTETSGYAHFEDEEEPEVEVEYSATVDNNDNISKIYPLNEGANEEAAPAAISTTVSSDNIFAGYESGDINFDKENEDLEENIDEAKLAEKEQEEQLNKLRQLVREKISPVSRGFDITTYSISKRPAASNISTPRSSGEKIGDWVLMSSQKPIYMRRFSGAEMQRLSDGGKGRTRLNRSLDTWNLIYSHIADPNKPATMEEWAKVTSFLDIDHIFMAIYRANFEGSNYIPFNCTNNNCTDKVFLSENFDIMDMCKFKDKAAKDKFNSLIGSQTSKEINGLYSTEIVPVSDTYAFSFKEPSIYNIIFESAVLDDEFVNKFDNLINMCSYIDEIYYINHATHELQPIRTNVYQNNMKKTVKSRIINFSKCISELGSDQYNTIIAYINKINETGNELTYQLPEVTCPACKTVIPASEQTAQSLVFIRHQLAALATL